MLRALVGQAMVFCGLSNFCGLSGAALAQQITQRTEMVPMRDGVKLSTDLYLPEGKGPFPVLVTRSPYNKNGERRRGAFFAQHGYVFVAQDCRGRFASEGEFYPLIHEARDGYDTIEWAAAQPWSSGKVGTTGASYLAIDQYAAAIENPPHLLAMYAAVGSENFYYDSTYAGGIPSLGWPVWNLFMASTDSKLDDAARTRLSAVVKDPDPWLRQSPADRAALLAPFAAYKRGYDDFYAHSRFDDYWKQVGFDTADYYARLKDVPILFLSGWYDQFADATIRNFTELRAHHKTQKRLIMGPWPHGYGKAECGDASFGKDGELDENALQLDWFDHWLIGAPFGTPGAEPVRYFRMGGQDGHDAKGRLTPGGEWKTALTWPPKSAPKQFPAASGTYDYDPKDPAPTKGGRYNSQCIQDQKLQRPDILTSLSEPLDAPLNITGKVEANVSITSAAPSVDVVVKLIDVYPDGYAALILEGATRVTPPVKAKVDLGSTSNLFAKGHRVRIDVTSSSFPRLEPNPHVAKVTIEPGSYVEVPVVR